MSDRLLITHLERACHDGGADVWCGTPLDLEAVANEESTNNVDECTCLRCLEELRAAGAEAHRRWSIIVRAPIGAAQTDADIRRLRGMA